MQFEEKIINDKLFVKILNYSDLSEKKGIKIQFEDDIDMQVAVFKINDELFCVSNICLHRHAEMIFDGVVHNHTVTCPLHGWCYSLKNGENLNKHQGIKSLATYEIIQIDGFIWIEKPKLEIPRWRRIE